MPKALPIGVALVGCGSIADAYVASIKTRPELVRLIGAYARHAQARNEFCQKHGMESYPDLDTLLSDMRVDLVVNITPAAVHVDITRSCLNAGKHVFSEKPLSLGKTEAQEIMILAEKSDLRLGCAPFTWMGEAQQTAWKAIRDDMIGKVRVVYADMNWSRVESWHPAPVSVFAAGVGPLWDVGVYPLTLLTTMFGPVRKVIGFSKTVLPQRYTLNAEPFTSYAPDLVIAGLEFVNGLIGRLTSSFYVGTSRQFGIEFHGDKGVIHLTSAHDFDAHVNLSAFPGREWRAIPYVKIPFHRVEWGRAIFDMVESMVENKAHRATCEQAVHIVDICSAITESSKVGHEVETNTDFLPPKPMPWSV